MRKRMPSCSVLPLILCFLGADRLAMAETYCVATNGNDSSAGTEAKPWKTLRKAAASVQPGDTVRIRAGDYFVGPTWIVNRAGTAERPVTYQAFGDGEVRITSGSVLPAGEWKHVKGAIYCTEVNQPVMAVFQNAYPLHLPGDRAKIFAVDDLIPNNRIFNNVFNGEGKRSGISLNSVGNRVWHNTFVGSAYAIEFYAGKPGNQVVNNIFQDAVRSFLIWSANSLPQSLDYNLYHNATAPSRWQRDSVVHQTFDGYQQAAGETHSRYENPRLTDASDARPRPGSPAIDAAVTVTEVPADIDGVPRPQGAACDIGAYEARPAGQGDPSTVSRSRAVNYRSAKNGFGRTTREPFTCCDLD